jgi:hypothetical protein
MDEAMANQPRVAKVLVALLVSMTLGAVVLMALGNNPPQGGPFCLSSYYSLDPVQDAMVSRAAQTPGRWNSIEIYYSGTEVGNIEQLASLRGLAGPDQLNFHFCLCNGSGGLDGQIQTTERWQKQWSAIPGAKWQGNNKTIRICVIADGTTKIPTGCQVKRAETLAEQLSRKLNIVTEAVYYPNNW